MIKINVLNLWIVEYIPMEYTECSRNWCTIEKEMINSRFKNELKIWNEILCTRNSYLNNEEE